jgi:hypothetical protein
MPDNSTAATLDLVKSALAPGQDINKSITTQTGLVAYDLQGPAKNLYPVLTPLRNVIPRVSGGVGVATNWKVINKITGSGFDAMGYVPEGQRSGRMSYTSIPKAANYVTIGEEDSVSFEAVNAGKTYEDVRATMAVRLLQKTMLKEENALLAANGSLQLGICPTPTLSASGSGATLPGGTYSVIGVALTLEGFMQSSVSAAGVATTKTVTGADGGTFSLNGGSSGKSASATQAVTLGQALSAIIAPVVGAVGYAWFVGAVGSETLQAITTINSAVFNAPLLTGNQAATALSASDVSANPGMAFDGLVTTALNPANSAYVKYLSTGVAGAGTQLTPSGFGTVMEIDDMLMAMWNTYQVSADVLYVNAQQLRDITKKCLSSSSASLLQYQNAAGLEGKPYTLTAGGVINSYFNPYTPEGGKMIPVRLHPKCAPGMIFGYCQNLPVHYQNNEVQNVAEVKTRQDYYQIDWPVIKRQWEAGVYSEQVLAVYAPFAMGVILNIAAG